MSHKPEKVPVLKTGFKISWGYGVLLGQGCLQYYLLDPDACDDQFSIVYEQGDKVAVNLNTQPEPALLEERPVSNFNACLNISIILTILTLVEMDRDFSLVVTPWYHLPTYFPCKGYCPLGRREVSTNRTYSRSTSGQMFFNLLPLCRLEILVAFVFREINRKFGRFFFHISFHGHRFLFDFRLHSITWSPSFVTLPTEREKRRHEQTAVFP